MNLFCRILGHELGYLPRPVKEWRIISTYAVKLDIYYCRRCGMEAEF